MNQTAERPAETSDTTLVDFWNEVLAPKFIQYQHILVGGLSRHSAAVMPALDIRQGERVLDVGCGFGDTALQLADLVGPTGSVLGVDCCQRFLDIAWERAEFNFCPNVKFANQDAEQGLDEAVYDFVFARFGTMFFANPVAGLRSMRKALKPGGRMAHIVWRQRQDNPWLSMARDTVLQFLPAPGESARSCGPGPFSMANESTVRAQMEAAGFIDIEFKRIDEKVLIGRTIADAIAFQLAIGPAGETFREAGSLAEERRPQIEAALAQLFAGVETDSQGLWMNSSSWLITATAPEANPLESVPTTNQRSKTMENATSTQTRMAMNGVNTEALIGARGAFAEAPEAARFTFRSVCDWVNGTHNRNTINGYFGLGQEHVRKNTFVIESDHPEVFAAEDTAATPTEVVLAALASCLTGGLAAVAQHRGIQLHSARATVEGDIDVQGILGMDPDVRNGFSAIRVNFEIEADASDEEIRALVAQSQKRSAVFDLLTNPTPVVVNVA